MCATWELNFLSIKKVNSQLESRELFYVMRMFRTESLRNSISVALRKLLQGGRRGSQTIFKFPATWTPDCEQAVWTSKIGHQVKEFSILCSGRYKPLGSLDSLLSSAPQVSGANPASLFTLLLAIPQLLSNPREGWQHLLDRSLEGAHSYLEASNRWWLRHFMLINMAGDTFTPQISPELFQPPLGALGNACGV